MGEPLGDGHRFVPITTAAAALNVSVKTAYRLARREEWRRTRHRPYEYSWGDIVRTHHNRSQKGTP